MLRSLELLQCGLVNSKCFQAHATSNRLFDLELSKHSSLEMFHTEGVNILDLDRIDERYLLSGGKAGSLCIHDLLNSSGGPSYKAKVACSISRHSRYAHSYSIDTVQWYPFDTGLFTSSGMDYKLKIWDTNYLKPADTIVMQNKITCHNMSYISTQHSLIAAALEYPHVVLLDPKSGSRSHELRGHRGHVTYVRWSPSSEYLLASGGIDNKIFLWDIRSAKGYLRTLDQHNGEARGSKKDLITAHNGVINSLKFTDDGLFLVSYGTDNHLRLWDVALCKNTLVNFGYIVNNGMSRQRGIDLCCDSHLPVVFVPSANHIFVYDLFSGLKVNNLVGHFSSVNCCVFRSSTQQLYSAGNDMLILLWTPDVDRELTEDEDPVKSQSSRIDLGHVNEDAAVESDDWSDSD